MRRRPVLVPLLTILSLSMILGLFLVFARPIDGDEGYYASAAHLTLGGASPYLDYFYPQSPLLPYFYAPAAALARSSLSGLRLFSLLLSIGALLPWGAFLARRAEGNGKLIWVGLLLVSLAPGLWIWNVTVKTYALANLGVLIVVWALDRGLSGRPVRWLVLAGLAAGLVVGVRLLYAPWAGFLALGLTWRAWGPGGDTDRRRQWLAFMGGLAAGLAPMLTFLALDPDRFWFNNLRYHILRNRPLHDDGLKGLARATAALAVFIRALTHDPLLGLQLVLAGLGLRYRSRRALGLSSGLTWLLGGGLLAHLVACLLPLPVYEQYFTGSVTPLAAPLAVAGLAGLATGRAGFRMLWGGLAATVLLATVGAVTIRAEMDFDEVWTFEHQDRVAAAIQRWCPPGETVFALWSGYPLAANRPWLRGMENHFGLEISGRLTVAQQRRYHIPGYEIIKDVLVHRRAKVLVLGAWMSGINSGIPQEQMAVLVRELNANYQVVEKVGSVDIARPLPGQASRP